MAVLLSAYDGARYLRAQIDSILAQTGVDVTLFVRDDGSDDETGRVLGQCALSHPQMHVVYGENRGYIASFFDLIGQAAASPDAFDYYALSDQDDVWDADKLMCAAAALETANGSGPLLYGSCSRLVSQSGRSLRRVTHIDRRPLTLYNTIVQNILPGHTQVFNRALLEEIAALRPDPARVYAHDAFITNVAALRGRIVFDRAAHASYRQHGGNELGYGKSPLEWVENRLDRFRRGDGRRYARQIAYLRECLGPNFSEEQRQEIDRFLGSQGLFDRLVYACRTRLYRQSPLETLAFRMAYFLGGYTDA